MRHRLRALILILVLAGASWAAARTPNGLAGNWNGTLKAGTIRVHVAMHLGNDK